MECRRTFSHCPPQCVEVLSFADRPTTVALENHIRHFFACLGGSQISHVARILDFMAMWRRSFGTRHSGGPEVNVPLAIIIWH